MSIIKKECLNCNKEFNARSQDVNRGYGKFCSVQCSGEYNGKMRKNEPNVKCAWCDTPFYRSVFRQSFSKSGLFFCTRKCKDAAQTFEGLKELHLPHFGSGNRCYRDIAFRAKPKVCERCGYDKHPAAIVVHHKDRNRENNDISNLEVLCAICHAIEHWGETEQLDLLSPDYII